MICNSINSPEVRKSRTITDMKIACETYGCSLEEQIEVVGVLHTILTMRKLNIDIPYVEEQ